MSLRNLRLAVAAVSLLIAPAQLFARFRAVQPPSIAPGPYAEGGYADKTSVLQGAQVGIHIATSVTPFTAEVINLATPSVNLQTRTGLTSTARDCNGQYAQGCQWPVTLTLTIPASWPSGYYAVEFPTSQGTRYAPFVVRSANPGSTSGIVVISATNTFQAFNEFGGASVQVSDEFPRADQVSFDRPYDLAAGLGGYVDWERDFSAWMRAQSIPFEVGTDTDLEDPTFLSRYTTVVLVGHSEYWTLPARTNLESFGNSGGHIAILGGNSMWWQARLENNDRTLVSYENAADDPETGVDNSIVTVNWFDDPVFNPENSITGASFRNGGYVNRAGDPSTWSSDPRTFAFKPMNERTGFTVLAAQSWVFNGAHVQVGQSFGTAAAGLEVDGAVFNCDAQGLPGAPDGSDGTPLNYQILAYTPATNGYGTVGIYIRPSGGAVFNAASEQWTSALATDSIVSLMTANVLERFATGQPFVYTPVTTAARTMDLFNCPQSSPEVLPWWQGVVGTAKLSARCAYEGPTGLELIGPGELAVARGFAPKNNGLQHVDIRFYINADGFSATTTDPIPLVTLRSHQGDRVVRFAEVELYIINGHKGIRLATLTPDGTALEQTTPFVDVQSGWQSIQVGWSSPGSVTFQVGDGTPATVQNPHSGQTANEIELYYPPLPSNDYVCVDAIAAGTEPLPPIAP